MDTDFMWIFTSLILVKHSNVATQCNNKSKVTWQWHI